MWPFKRSSPAPAIYREPMFTQLIDRHLAVRGLTLVAEEIEREGGSPHEAARARFLAKQLEPS